MLGKVCIACEGMDDDIKKMVIQCAIETMRKLVTDKSSEVRQSAVKYSFMYNDEFMSEVL